MDGDDDGVALCSERLERLHDALRLEAAGTGRGTLEARIGGHWGTCESAHAPASCALARLSRPLVGSSRKSSLGLASISDAIESRLRSPPEMPRCLGPPT